VESSRFSLIKWYMDCVTDDGDAAIVYCADLRWGGMQASYSSALSVRDGASESHSSMGRFNLSSSAERIAVEVPRLGVTGSWDAAAEPFQKPVFENASGSVVWNCLQPLSSANLRVGERELTGLGYAECLTVTLPPWRLPMRQLRWGRFVSAQDSLAWVDWQGPYSIRFAVYNGRECETLTATDSAIEIHDATLKMEESFSLRAGRLGSTILPEVPALRKLLPHSLFNIEEQKWRSRGVLNARDRSSRGWVIHEVVHWKL